MSTKKIILICFGILLLAVVVTTFIFMTEPEVSPEGATRKSAMLVEVIHTTKGDYHPTIIATGTVKPVEDVMLSSLVGGRVIRRSPNFIPGGFVREGALLLKIDPSDYQNDLQLQKSELRKAQTELIREMGRQEVAEQDLALIGGDSLSPNQRSLILREPQLNAAKATVRAAEASVRQAELNLERTSIRAPFDAHILSQEVTIGSRVSPGDILGRVVGTEKYWVTLALPVDKLKWLSFPGSDQEASLVKIKNNTAWSEETYRLGYLQEQIGALDDQTRLARVLVSVPDPLAKNKENEDLPNLMIGSFVEARIKGEEIKNVVRLPREYVRRNKTVWVMEDNKLSIRDVDIELTDAQYAYISKGLKDNEKVVTTNLSTVTQGIRLRIKEKENNKTGGQELPEEQ
ncbi:MAG TPA: efflux RND transporter periplasmic adaptor subunit [Salinimicrobium sp.]|nr:efflux RND transporter periplasmic adaptor subunit [Salinimicrobium sp.]